MAFDPFDYNAYKQICLQYPGIFIVKADGTMPDSYHYVDGRMVNIGDKAPMVDRYVAFDDAAIMISQGSSRFRLWRDTNSGHLCVCGPKYMNLLDPLLTNGCPCIVIDRNGCVIYQSNLSVAGKSSGTPTSEMDNDRIDVEWEIVGSLGVLSATKGGWTKELNLVCWNNGLPKYDIRLWAPNHLSMGLGNQSGVGRGISLTLGEARELKRLLEKCLPD